MPTSTPTTDAPAWADGALGTAEPVEVRRAGPGEAGQGAAGAPAQFLWRGGLWLVRTAERAPAGPAGTEVWRVWAGRGNDGPEGAYALTADVRGGWWLQRVAR